MGHTQPLEVVQPGGVYVPVQGGVVHRGAHAPAAASLRHAAGRVGGKTGHMHLPHTSRMGGDSRAFILRQPSGTAAAWFSTMPRVPSPRPRGRMGPL